VPANEFVFDVGLSCWKTMYLYCWCNYFVL